MDFCNIFLISMKFSKKYSIFLHALTGTMNHEKAVTVGSQQAALKTHNLFFI